MFIDAKIDIHFVNTQFFNRFPLFDFYPAGSRARATLGTASVDSVL